MLNSYIANSSKKFFLALFEKNIFFFSMSQMEALKLFRIILVFKKTTKGRWNMKEYSVDLEIYIKQKAI